MQKKKDGLYQRQDSPYWWGSFIDGRNKRVRRSTGIRQDALNSRREAEALLAKWKAEAHQQRMWGAPETETHRHKFDDVILQYLTKHKTRTPMSKRKSAARPLYRVFAGREMSAITDVEVRQYVNLRMETVVPATVNKEVGLFAAACRWCQDHLGWKIPNPAAGKKRRELEGRVRHLTQSEAVRFIEAARRIRRAPWLAPFVQLSIYTGMRRGEAVGLTWDRVDLQCRVVMLEETKSARRRAVPLNNMALAALEHQLAFRQQYCPGAPGCSATRRAIR